MKLLYSVLQNNARNMREMKEIGGYLNTIILDLPSFKCNLIWEGQGEKKIDVTGTG